MLSGGIHSCEPFPRIHAEKQAASNAGASYVVSIGSSFHQLRLLNSVRMDDGDAQLTIHS